MSHHGKVALEHLKKLYIELANSNNRGDDREETEKEIFENRLENVFYTQYGISKERYDMALREAKAEVRRQKNAREREERTYKIIQRGLEIPEKKDNEDNMKKASFVIKKLDGDKVSPKQGIDSELYSEKQEVKQAIRVDNKETKNREEEDYDY